MVEQVKIMVGKMKEAPPELGGQIGSTKTVFLVPPVVQPPGVVKDRKEFDHIDSGPGPAGQGSPGFQHPCPVGQAVDASRRERILPENGLDQCFWDHGQKSLTTGVAEHAERKTGKAEPEISIISQATRNRGDSPSARAQVEG
jgi:hypothetical protein